MRNSAVKHFTKEGFTIAVVVENDEAKFGIAFKSDKDKNFIKKRGFSIAMGRANSKHPNIVEKINIAQFKANPTKFLMNLVHDLANKLSENNFKHHLTSALMSEKKRKEIEERKEYLHKLSEVW